MKVLISGHRIQKLAAHDTRWIKETISALIEPHFIGLSGMASGVDLWFCEALKNKNCGYYCYIPFEEQGATMSEEDAQYREELIKLAWGIKKVKNSRMVEDCDMGIIVWDGNKGGTHNVFQQMVEAGKNFWWIEPTNKKVVYMEWN